jgi:hypothetical protein
MSHGAPGFSGPPSGYPQYARQHQGYGGQSQPQQQPPREQEGLNAAYYGHPDHPYRYPQHQQQQQQQQGGYQQGNSGYRPPPPQTARRSQSMSGYGGGYPSSSSAPVPRLPSGNVGMPPPPQQTHPPPPPPQLQPQRQSQPQPQTDGRPVAFTPSGPYYGEHPPPTPASAGGNARREGGPPQPPAPASTPRDLASRLARYNLSPDFVALLTSAPKVRSLAMRGMARDEYERLIESVRALPVDLQREIGLADAASAGRGGGGPGGTPGPAAAGSASMGRSPLHDPRVDRPGATPYSAPRASPGVGTAAAAAAAAATPSHAAQPSRGGSLRPTPLPQNAPAPHTTSHDSPATLFPPTPPQAQAAPPRSSPGNTSRSGGGAGGGGGVSPGRRPFVVQQKGKAPPDAREFRVLEHLVEFGTITETEDEDAAMLRVSLDLLNKARYVVVVHRPCYRNSPKLTG